MSQILKTRANQLRRALAESYNIRISTAQSLELVAKEENYPNWDAACASYGKATSNQAKPLFHDLKIDVKSDSWSLSSIFENRAEALSDVLKALDLSKTSGALVVVSGTTGQGKSTTVDEVIKELKSNNPGLEVSTLDDLGDGVPYARVITLDEIRDFDDAFRALSLVQMGYKVLATMHAVNALQTWDRLKYLLKIGMGDLVDTIAGEACVFIHQQLVWLDSGMRQMASDNRMRQALTLHGYDAESVEKLLVQGPRAVFEAVLNWRNNPVV